MKIEDGETFDKEVLSKIESEYGIKVPSTFAEILLENSDGYLTRGSFFSFDNPHCPSIKNETLYHLASLDKESYLSFSEIQTESDYGIPGLFLIGKCSMDWFVCLDYRKVKENPPVVIIIPDQPDGYEEIPLLLANSFDEFWNSLILDPHNEGE